MQQHNQFSNPPLVIRQCAKRWPLHLLACVLCLSIVQTGCSQISLPKKAAHNLIKEPSLNEEQNSASSTQLSKPIDLTGEWKIGFRFQGKTGLGSMQLTQTDQNFSGSGKDDSGVAFKIDHGSIKDNEIIFLKRYEANPSQAVQYHGQFSLLSADNGQQIPYMGGDFSLESNGNLVAGEWEASKNVTQQEASQNNQNPPSMNETQSPAQQQAPDYDAKSNKEINATRSPDLSGKWRLAFEYNFKTIHSTMFLEQDGNKLNGHGIDTETKNRFVIKNGSYHFPRLSFVRHYLDNQPAKHAIPLREMTFKAEVTVISDPDYQGPYLSGKTEGGGNWEAERVD